jgi:hypothetical protein
VTARAAELRDRVTSLTAPSRVGDELPQLANKTIRSLWLPTMLAREMAEQVRDV